MGYVFQPSVVLDEIYDLIEDYMEATDVYNADAIKVIQEYLESLNVQYTEETLSSGFMGRGAYAVSWIVADKPVLMLINYVVAD